MRSTLTAEYSAKMRQRVEAVKPKRHVKILTDASLGQAGSNLKMIQSGAMQTNAGFNTAVSIVTSCHSLCLTGPQTHSPHPRLADPQPTELRPQATIGRWRNSLSSALRVFRETNYSTSFSLCLRPSSRFGRLKNSDAEPISLRHTSKRSLQTLPISIAMGRTRTRSA